MANETFRDIMPYDKLNGLGISAEAADAWPPEVRDALLSGNPTPLVKTSIKVGDRRVSIPVKLQLATGNDGVRRLLATGISRDIDNKLGFSDAELDRMGNGETIRRDSTFNGRRDSVLYQFDPETNSLLRRDLDKIKIEESMAMIDKIKDVELGREQKERILEGKPVELNVGDEKCTVGVDLREPGGFKMVNGDMEEWNRQKALAYDREHPEYIGLEQTDRNRWEYKQFVDAHSSSADVRRNAERNLATKSGFHL